MRILGGIVLTVVLYMVLFKVIQYINTEYLGLTLSSAGEWILIGVVGLLSLLISVGIVSRFKQVA